MRVVSASKGNTGKAHLAWSRGTETLCKRDITGDRVADIPEGDRCKRCASLAPDAPWGMVPVTPDATAPVTSNRPADVPGVDPSVTSGYGLADVQITAIERMISRLPYGAAATWVRQLGTGEVVLVDLQTHAPDAADIAAVIGERVTLTRDDRHGRYAIYRLHRDPRWCRDCFWVNGHGPYCSFALARKRPAPALRGQLIDRTDEPCPLCATEGRRNNGGNVPTLSHFPDDTRRFCTGLHGWVTDAERAAAASH